MVKRNTYRLLVGKPEEKRPLERHRWVDNIRMDLGMGDVDWNGLAQDEHVDSSCEFGIEPSGSTNAGKLPSGRKGSSEEETLSNNSATHHGIWAK
jgi:hypothetical protein